MAAGWPVPGSIERLMSEVEVVMALPSASSTVTWGSSVQVCPDAPPPGSPVKASWAGPLTKISVLTALRESAASVAVRVNSPPRSMAQPVKLATPLDAASEFALWSQVSVAGKPLWAAPPGPVRVKVILELVETVSFEESSIVTTGWLARAVPGEPSPGGVVKTSWVGTGSAPAEDKVYGSRPPTRAAFTRTATTTRGLQRQREDEPLASWCRRLE